VLRVGDAGRRVMVELGRLGPPERRHDAGEDDGERVAAGIDDTRLAEHRQ